MKKRLIPAIAVLSALILGCGSAAIAGPTAQASVQVTNDRSITRTHEGPFLLVDRMNPSSVYLSEAELQTGQCRFYTSTNHGDSWIKAGSPNLAPYSCSPGTGHPQSIRTDLAQASNGTLLYAFAGNDPAASGARSVLLGRSTDHGQTWQTAPVYVAPRVTPDTFGNAELNYQAHVAVDPGNPRNVYVVWRRAYPNFQGKVLFPNRSWMAASTDGGTTFGEAFRVFDKDTSSDSPFLFFAKGKLSIAYTQAFARPAGATVSPPNEVHFATTSDGGRSWTDSKISTANFADGPNAVYDPTSKKFDVVWDDNRNGEFDSFYSSSADGSTWTEPKKLNDDPKRVKGHLFPILGLSPGGRLDVAWYDFRNDPYPADTGPFAGDQGKRADVYTTSSSDGGRTWSANLRLNNLVIDRTKGIQNPQYSFFVPLSLASGDSWKLAAWSDTRNGDSFSSTQDIYTGQVLFNAPVTDTGGGNFATALTVAGIGGIAGGAGVALLIAVAVIRRRQARTSQTAGA